MSVESFEREILGAALRGIAWEYELHPSEMSLDNHRIIWGAIAELVHQEIPVSVTTVADQLGNKLESVGGRGALEGLRDDAVITDPSHLAYDVRRIRGASQARRIKSKAESISLMNGAAVADLQREAAELAEIAAESVGGGVIRNLADIPSLFELDIPEPKFVVPELIRAREVTVIAGQSETGKSYIMEKAGIAVATGGKFLGRECEQRAVLLLDRENSDSEIKQRIQVMAGGDVPGLRVWGNWLSEGPPDLSDPRLLKWAKQCGPVIIVDSLIDFLDGDEQSSNDIAKFFKPVHRLKNAGATVVVIHHSSDKTNAETYRGSSGIKAEADVFATLTAEPDTGLLTWTQIKNRGGKKISLTIRPDFSTGEFEQTDSPAAEEKRNEVSAIQELIESQPGISQNQIKESARLGFSTVKKILTANNGRLWRKESGKRGATLYYPMSLVPPVPTCSGTPETG